MHLKEDAFIRCH
ncbi:hypothetical protein D049_3412A, partial [Vibrio parahaemolyticus VPTS-2010]